MAGKTIKVLQKEIKDAVEKYNSTHEKKLEFVSKHTYKGGEARYAERYKLGDKEFSLVGCKTNPCMAVTLNGDVEYMDEFLETLT